MTDSIKQDQPSNKNEGAPAYYALARAKVEHEDQLVNQRLGWLLVLQGFLFGAYGFSMSAEGTSLGGRAYELNPTPAAIHAKEAFAQNLNNLRQGLALIGMVSTLIALAGVLAAFRAIRDDEAELTRFPRLGVSGYPLFPNIIGSRSTNVLGMFCGLGMPFLIFFAWILVGRIQGNLLLIAVGVLVLALVSTLLYIFVKLVPR